MKAFMRFQARLAFVLVPFLMGMTWQRAKPKQVINFDPLPQSSRVGQTQPNIRVTPVNGMMNVVITLVEPDDGTPIPAELNVAMTNIHEFLISDFRPLRSGSARFEVRYANADGRDLPDDPPAPVYSDPFPVYAWQSSAVDCYADGTIVGFAATQTPPPTVEIVGSCVLTTSGGDPVGVSLGNATCASASGTATCADGPGSTNCFSVGTALGMAGTDVNVTWTGDTVPAGSAMGVLPQSLTFAPLPATLTREQPFTVSYSGGTAVGTVVLTALVPHLGSVMGIECTASAGDGALTVPASVTRYFSPGMANLGLYYFTGSTVFAGDFKVDARVNGTVVGLPDPISITVN